MTTLARCSGKKTQSPFPSSKTKQKRNETREAKAKKQARKLSYICHNAASNSTSHPSQYHGPTPRLTPLHHSTVEYSTVQFMQNAPPSSTRNPITTPPSPSPASQAAKWENNSIEARTKTKDGGKKEERGEKKLLRWTFWKIATFGDAVPRWWGGGLAGWLDGLHLCSLITEVASGLSLWDSQLTHSLTH